MKPKHPYSFVGFHRAPSVFEERAILTTISDTVTKLYGRRRKVGCQEVDADGLQWSLAGSFEMRLPTMKTIKE